MRGSKAILAIVTLAFGLAPAATADAQSKAPRLGARTPSMRLATTKATAGFSAMPQRGGGTIFVASKATLAPNDVVRGETLSLRDGQDVELTLTETAANRIATAMQQQGASRLVVVQQGQAVSVGTITMSDSDTRMIVSGLTPTAASRLVRLTRSNAPVNIGTRMSLSTTQTAVAPGELVTVEVMLSSASDVRTYQATVFAEGGDSGSLMLEDVKVQTQRPDYVFLGEQKLEAADKRGGRIGAVLFDGGVDVTEGNLGTFYFRASTDAAGTFSIVIRNDNNASILMNSKNEPVDYAVAGPVRVIVAATREATPVGR